MIIDIQDIQDYMFCPVYLKLKKDNISTNNIYIQSKYDEVIKKFTYAYNDKLSNDKVSFNDVKNYFGRLWMLNKNKEDYIYMQSSKNDTYNKLRVKGINKTITFHEHNIKNPYKPIATNYKYAIDIMPNIKLTGSIDLIREKDNLVQVVSYIPTHNYSSINNLNNDIKTVASVFAFRKIFNTEEDSSVVYSFDRDKEYLLNINDTTFNKLKFNIMNVVNSIKNNIYYFTSYDRCSKCKYSNLCNQKKYINNIIGGQYE